MGTPPLVFAGLSKKAKRKQVASKSVPASEPAAAAQAAAFPSAVEELTAEQAAPEPPVVLEAAPAVCGEAVFPLPSEDWARLRVRGKAPLYQAILSAARAVGDDEAEWKAFTSVNRDLLDYRFLYKLTAQLLSDTHLGDEKAAEEKRAIRLRIVRSTLNFDGPLFQEVGEAEGRLGQVLALYMAKKTPSAKDVVAAAGNTAPQIFCFWLVILAAIAAWESKLGVPTVTEMARAKIEELSEVRSLIEERPSLMEQGGIGELVPLLRLPPIDYEAWDTLPPAERLPYEEALSQIGDPDERELLLRRLGCIHCQCQRHAVQAYEPITTRVAMLQDVLLFGICQPIELEETNAPTQEEKGFYNSYLVQLEAESEEMVREDIGVQLYW